MPSQPSSKVTLNTIPGRGYLMRRASARLRSSIGVWRRLASVELEEVEGAQCYYHAIVTAPAQELERGEPVDGALALNGVAVRC